jgi:hypothetical protein
MPPFVTVHRLFHYDLKPRFTGRCRSVPGRVFREGGGRWLAEIAGNADRVASLHGLVTAWPRARSAR